MKKPFMLMILDGFGLNPSDYGNAIASAKTPNLDEIFKRYPHTSLSASGQAVGLPEGQMGNSEVGHLNIGAGRVVYQELTRISKAIEDGLFAGNIALTSAIDHAKSTGGALHILGLMSEGGVHSHMDHIKATIAMAVSAGAPAVYVHSFMDGRDVPPTSGAEYIEDIKKYIEGLTAGSPATCPVTLGTIIGRYYAMDRDKRWERVKIAYDALVSGHGVATTDPVTAVKKAYSAGETDEFIKPIICSPSARIKSGDSVIFCNFRPDRARELTRTFVDPDFDGFEIPARPENLCYVCMTQYDLTMPNVKVAFPPATIKNTLGEWLSKQDKTQLRIAETEKYAHVTFFFNGGVEKPNPLEDRVLIPSPKVATYDLQPQMSAFQVADKVVEEIKSSKYDCIILNFANADMVGHTGVFEAAVKAIEAVDSCVAKVSAAILQEGGQLLLTADHGNADCMLDQAGNAVTAHSTNPVPLVHIAKNPVPALLEGGKLCDIAPTMLYLMGLEIPGEMTGRVLVEKK